MTMTKNRFLTLLVVLFTLVSVGFTNLSVAAETELWTVVWGMIATLGWTIDAIIGGIWATAACISYYEKLPR